MRRSIIKWRYDGGGMLVLRNGRVIRPGETFIAAQHEISPAFMDVIKKLSVEEPEKPIIAVKTKYFPQKRETSNFYDVIRQDGKVMNTKALRKAEVDEYIKTLED